MSEKRKPSVKILAEVKGKTVRLELFGAWLWPRKFPSNPERCRWRIRINGKWANGDTTYTMSEALRQLRGWVRRRIEK